MSRRKVIMIQTKQEGWEGGPVRTLEHLVYMNS
jgi:hypothetical protein